MTPSSPSIRRLIPFSVSFALCAALGLGIASRASAAPVIAYDIYGSDQLSATASYTQSPFSASQTINEVIALSTDAVDGWAIQGGLSSPQTIQWSFDAGLTTVDAIQLITYYRFDEVLYHFKLEYTTDGTTFSALTGLTEEFNDASLGGLTISGNEVTGGGSFQPGEYQLSFGAVSATGIRLTTLSNPGPGSGNLNFVLSEVSFRTAEAIPEPSWLLGFGALGLAAVRRRLG